MKNWIICLVILFTVIMSCQEKKKEVTEQKTFISAVALIKAQVALVDSGLYSIVKTVTIDGVTGDTVYLPREKFAEAAHDFLEVPDLSDKKIAKRFKEDYVDYDTTIKRAIFTYIPNDANKENIKKIELLVTPILGEESKVTNIIINWSMVNRDSSIEKKMLWQTDKSFQVMTTTQKPGKPGTTVFTKVSWNEGLN